MPDFELALQAEIDALDAELRADPRHEKLRELRRIQMLYNGASAKAYVAPERSAVTAKPRRSASPERKAILDAAKMVIAGKGRPVPTSEIFEIIALTVEIPGRDPKNNLSAMLSNSPEFISHGRSGWTLASETPEATDDQIARSASVASMSSPASPAGEPSSVRPVDPAPGGGT